MNNLAYLNKQEKRERPLWCIKAHILTTFFQWKKIFFYPLKCEYFMRKMSIFSYMSDWVVSYKRVTSFVVLQRQLG